MRTGRRAVGIALVAGLGACGAEPERPAPERGAPASRTVWREGPRLPAPVTGHVVAAVRGREGVTLLSFLGVGAPGAPEEPTRAAHRWDVGDEDGWRAIEPVPGPPRVGATAQAFAGRVFLFGGTVRTPDGGETTVGTVSVYTPGTGAWGWASDMPTPVTDAMSGVWAHSFVYVVSGRQDGGGVVDVQLFDPSLDLWSNATPIAGPPVFGHAGAIAGTDVVYLGGVSGADDDRVREGRPWRGRIDAAEPAHIAWQQIPAPPGPQLRGGTGAAAGPVVLVAGASVDGGGVAAPGGEHAEAATLPRLLAWAHGAGWTELTPPPGPSVEHPALAVAGGYVFLVGGTGEGGRATDRVWYAEVDALLDEGGVAPAGAGAGTEGGR